MNDDDALAQLGSVLETLSEGWHDAFEHIRTTCTNPDYDERYKSTALQMESVIRVKQRLIAAHEALYHRRHTQHIFTIPEVAHIVLKQLNPNLLPNRGLTRHARQFYSQEPLEGLPDLPRLVCGCVVDDQWTDLVGVYLTHPKGRGRINNWVLNITNFPQAIDFEQERMDFMLPENDGTHRKNRYKPKHGYRKDQDDGEASAGALG